MSFSPAQQGMFRPLVKQAWESHCSANAVALKDKPARLEWYRAELLECIGAETTSACDKGRDFEKVMAHFESLIGDSIYWNMRIFSGDARRILHEINKLATGHQIDEDYMRRIACQSLQTDHLPELLKLSADDLFRILRALRIYIRRRLKRDDEKLTPGPDASDEIQWSYAARKAAASAPADIELTVDADQPF